MKHRPVSDAKKKKRAALGGLFDHIGQLGPEDLERVMRFELTTLTLAR